MSVNSGPCKAPGCDRQASAAGECRRHYHARRRWGKYEPTLPCRKDNCSRPAIINRSGVSTGRCAWHSNPREGDLRPAAQGYTQVFRDGEWVAEHRAVMEEKLGRQLVGRENVHHINGDRADNRIENLELWFSPQPYGQRVEDLLRYVVEVHRDRVVAMLEKEDS